jgi:glycerophosphoryl diester phosphodiesterase
VARPVPLPAAFLDAPIAHRALHDRTLGRPENSLAAVRAAVEAGYGIEIDLQPSSDGVPMVFHDYDLRRLTGETGPVSGRSAHELAAMRLHGTDEPVPTLADVLAVVDGRVPLLIEIKDQDGGMGPDVGPLERAAARCLAGYSGPLAVMSFNPHSMAVMAEAAPDIPRGLTTSAWDPDGWPLIPGATLERLRDIPDFDRVAASFISHEAADLGRSRVADLKQAGASILCWTIRSQDAEAKARVHADNVTFEGYRAAIRA